MELRHLRHLMAVVEHGSFSRAAETVHLTQSALSRSIQALEAEVGTAVVERQRGDVAPTAIGQLLLDHARRLDVATRDLERDIALTKGLELGELRIGVGPYGGSALVGPVMGRLNQLHPGLQVKAVLAPWQELPERARARDVDLVVLELSQVQEMDDFALQPMAEHALLTVCRPQHPLTQLPAPTLADVFAYPSAGPTVTDMQRNALLAHVPAALQEGLRKRGLPTLECDLASTLKDILLHSDATALMPSFVVRRELELGLLAALPRMNLGLRVRFGCAWLAARTVSPVAARFMELLAEHDRHLVTHSQSRP